MQRDRSAGRSRFDRYGSRQIRPADRGAPRGQWALFLIFGIIGIAGALAAAAATKAGHTIDTALMRFLLFYGGVFALVGLTAAVRAGPHHTGRITMTPTPKVLDHPP